MTVENDVATGSDNNYTNGIGMSWVSNAIKTYDEKSFVRRWGNSGRSCRSSARTVTAPMSPGRWRRRCIRRTTSSSPIRPWTISPMPASCTSTTSLCERRALDACVAAQGRRGGSASQADTCRSGSTTIGGDEPMGWDTQLPNEPIINVGYTGAYLLARGNSASRPSGDRSGGQRGLGNYFTGRWL